ncbi:MAG: hypothetical protein A2218_08965 [Elusimicrobia bacterium RIFOXYA2_FULL_53_38]|nr:MAG: hypothetical protein A2218_08965 [Elusimicrobia bacterium RIFOXYA2_FULL_53_38]
MKLNKVKYMNQEIIFTVSLIVFYCGNSYCQPCKQAPSAFETLGAIATDGKGFDNGVAISGFQRQASFDNVIPVSPSSLVLPDFAAEKGVTNELSVYYLKELGNPPSKVEASKIEQALNVLNDSKIGKEICKSIGKIGCTWEDFKAAKIEITTRDLKYHLPEPLESILSLRFASADPTAAVPKPSFVNGRTILCLDQELISKKSPAYIATYVLHELSHIADNRKLGEWDTQTTNLHTEYKAVAIQMMVHDELLRTGKLKDTADGVQFLLSVYRWRNGGPKPNMDFSTTINEKHYSAKEILGLTNNPGDTGLKVILHMTKLFYGITEGTMTEKDLKYLLGVRGVIKELEPKYQSWFPSNPPAVVVPPNNGGGGGGGDNDDGDGDGGGNPGGGGGGVNPCPNPHFNPDGSAGC